MSIKVDIYELDRGKDGWKNSSEDLKAYLESRPTTPSFIFASADHLKGNQSESKSLHAMLENFYRMPNEIWTKVHWESNGYYGCSDEEVDRHDTWYRFLVKQIYEEDGKEFPKDYGYSWDKLGFFTTWSKAGPKCMLCLDCPDDLIQNMKASLNKVSRDQFFADPYSFHQIAIRGIVNLYDKSIWKIRDVVRTVEKSRPKMRKPEVDYDHLHEAARHVIHSTETLLVSTQLLEQMMMRQRDRMNSLTYAPEEEKICMRQVGDNLMFYHSMIHAFKCRSESMQARHQNEIQLAFNTVAQYHSHVAAVDSAAMKVIAVLTAAFLPATFVSAIFSMSFFNNGGDNGTSAGGGDGGGESWSLSDKFWIYWAFAVPLTAVTIFLLTISNRILRYLNMI
ncbi:hypothetical protein TWF730_006074 [Orbilia blumenaviensis]|uniref:Uncharacterized protein n=1 Tax=Orbilia blumenaviensis TaxID=1796055 RepID=A0AAV9TZ99_9PEZI